MIPDSIIDHHAQALITDEWLALPLRLPPLGLGVGALPDAGLGGPGGLRVVVDAGAQTLALVVSVASAAE